MDGWGWVGELVAPVSGLVDDAWYTEAEKQRDAIAREGALAMQYQAQASVAAAQVGLAQQEANVKIAVLAAGGLVVAVALFALLK